jgi:hypothetical protein
MGKIAVALAVALIGIAITLLVPTVDQRHDTATGALSEIDMFYQWALDVSVFHPTSRLSVRYVPILQALQTTITGHLFGTGVSEVVLIDTSCMLHHRNCCIHSRHHAPTPLLCTTF